MKKVLLVLTFTIFSFLNTSCFDAIFQGIRDEVELNDSVINGFLNSIVRYTDKNNNEWLYLQNGLVYRKLISDSNGGLTNNARYDAWSKVGQPGGGLSYDYFGQEFDGTYACKLATDENYIYMLGATPVYDEDHGRNVLEKFKLYYFNGNGWAEVSAINGYINTYIGKLDKDYYMMDASLQLFCTNAPKKEHRKAFIRIGGGNPDEPKFSSNQKYGNDVALGNCAIFELNGATATFVNEGEGKVSYTDANDASKKVDITSGAGKGTLSCVWFDNEVKFFNTISTVTDETKTADPKRIYYASSKNLSYFDKTKATEVGGSADDTIISICVTKDSVLLGTDEEGVFRCAIAEDGTVGDMSGSKDAFPSNMRTQLDDPYVIRTLFSTDPSLKETSNVLYASKQFYYTQSNAAAVYRDVGLWAYYPSKGEWNRE